MVLTACGETTNNDYKFIGESEHWKAEHSYKGTELWGEDELCKIVKERSDIPVIF